MADLVECPNCGKRSLLERQPELYQCLNCDFRRDLNRPTVKASPASTASTDLSFLLVLFVMLLLLLRGEPFFSAPAQTVPQYSRSTQPTQNYTQ